MVHTILSTMDQAARKKNQAVPWQTNVIKCVC